MRSRITLIVALAVGMLLVLGVGSAGAVACGATWTGNAHDNNWFTTGNWSTNAVPGSGTDVCVAAASVNIPGQAATASSLQLTNGATLGIEDTYNGTTYSSASLTLSNGGSVDSSSAIDLTSTTTAGPGGGAATLENAGATALSNAGVIQTELGSDTGTPTRELDGNITSTGTIHITTPTAYDVATGGTLDVQGLLSIDNNTVLAVATGHGGTVFDDTNGIISNNGGSGDLLVQDGDTFEQGSGAISPATVNPASPAVVVEGTTTPAMLTYIGNGAGAIDARQQVTLSGSPGFHQNLVVDGAACPATTTVTLAGSFSNGGTITMTGSCSSGVAITSGGLTNTGTIDAEAGAARFLDTTQPLIQTAGATTLAPGATLALGGGAGTIALQGGLLQGPGVINGSVNNTGGNVAPGSPTTPGSMSIDGSYTQGSGGTLTAVIDGRTIGSGYSQLGVGTGSTIAGTLAINTLSGFTPNPGDTYTVLGGSAVAGTFSTVTGQFPAEGSFPPGWTVGYAPTYNVSSVTLVAQSASGLRVTLTGPGEGTVTSSPPGIDCPTANSPCDAPYFANQTVTLTAAPDSGWAFGGWGGPCSGTGTTCQVSMSQAQSVTADFANPTSIAVGPSFNPQTTGSPVTYTAVVGPTPDAGTVAFTDGGTTIPECGSVAVSTSTGKATCTVTYTAVSSHQIVATYSGDADFAGSQSSAVTESIIAANGGGSGGGGGGGGTTVTGKTITVSGAVKVTINCLARLTPCVVIETLTTRQGRRTIVIARRVIKIRHGNTKTIRLTLNATGRRLLRKLGKLHVRLTVKTRSGRLVLARRLVLKA
jgi:hypothetical protein